jgi:hypothetical protein
MIASTTMIPRSVHRPAVTMIAVPCRFHDRLQSATALGRFLNPSNRARHGASQSRYGLPAAGW